MNSMEKLISRLIFSVLFIALFISCQNSTEKKKNEAVSSDQLAKEIAKSLPSEPEKAIHPGKAVYDKYCLTCHQADGSGVPNMHPPLGSGSWVGKDPTELIAIMMKGLSGKIEVDGEIYNSFMPSHAKLTDDEMANVLSYIRSSFGNNFEPVTPDMVKKIRAGK